MAEPHRPDGPLSPLGLLIVAGVVALDQASKAIAEARLASEAPVEVLPILSLYRVHNTGIAFSFLSGMGGFGLIALTVAIAAVVLTLWWRSNEGGRLATAGYALIIGGAIGNLLDRLIHGHVIDFLLLHIGERTLFVFNLADAALTLGPILLLFVYMPAKRSTPV